MLRSFKSLDNVKKRALVHRLHEQGFTVEVIAGQVGMDQRYVTRALRNPKPDLIELPRSQAWRDRAACIDADTDLFYPDCVGLKAQEKKEQAKAICQSCPVIQQCREAAIANFEMHGVWAGEDFSNYHYKINDQTGTISVWEKSRRGTLKKVS